MYMLLWDIPTQPIIQPVNFDGKTKIAIAEHMIQHENLCHFSWYKKSADPAMLWAQNKPIVDFQLPDEKTAKIWSEVGLSIHDYTGSWYRELNRDLRLHFSCGDSLDQKDCEFFNAIQYAPTYEGKLYRGVENNRHITYSPGMVIDWTQVTSLTVDPTIARGFASYAGSVVFEITNAYGYLIDPYSEYHGIECEIVALPCRLRVDNVRMCEFVDKYGATLGCRTVVTVTVIDQLPVAFESAQHIL